ncbi:MAG: phosphomannomutase [Rhizobiaceae bacterium]|nr:phosphomannomutase [Rhizobiaceae bacterium]
MNDKEAPVSNGTIEQLKFGTSGLRGLATLLEGVPAYSYTAAFVQMLRDRGELQPGNRVLLGRDLRESSQRILDMCAAGISAVGMRPVDCGAIPTPALALAAMQENTAAIMVTGSHIPADRNGLKFYKGSGEIDKNDEAAITALESSGVFRTASATAARAEPDADVLERYKARYSAYFKPSCLSGLKVGVWQHSSVARDLLCEILGAFGADVVAVGRADHFVAVDTEAVCTSDREQVKSWSQQYGFDAVVSTDGDADRPLIFDAGGMFVDGDLLGAITAKALGANIIVSPVTSNSGLEGCGFFDEVLRCRVGSPYVIEGMEKAAGPGRIIVGFEANGGVLLGSRVVKEGHSLEALPTRDCALPLLSSLAQMASEGRTLRQIAADFRFRSKAAGRLEHIAQSSGAALLAHLGEGEIAIPSTLNRKGNLKVIDTSDGVRLGFDDGSILHFRMSGNAPELRCYTEDLTPEGAEALLDAGFELARTFFERGSKA